MNDVDVIIYINVIWVEERMYQSKVFVSMYRIINIS